eukprot:COSAG05_NODE_18938_length_300_cov_1.024876_1_plen_26_part_10
MYKLKYRVDIDEALSELRRAGWLDQP